MSRKHLLLIISIIIFAAQIARAQKDRENFQPSIKVVDCRNCSDIIISLPNPEYPNLVGYGAHKYSGEVFVQILIDEKGNVESAQAISGHPFFRPLLERAALKALFKPTFILEKPVKIKGIIIYQIKSENIENENLKLISLGILNDKAKVLPLPKLPNGGVRVAGSVNILVKIDLQKGEVVSASAISGHPLLRVFAEIVARQAKFEPVLTEFPTIYGTGILNYKVEDFTGKVVENKTPNRLLAIVSGGILNGKATKLEKPEFSEEAREACVGGKVEIEVLIYEGTGEIISAKAVSGNELLRKSSEEAVMKSKFSSANIDGNKDFYVKGRIVYQFPQPKCVGVNVINGKVLSVPKPKIKNSIRRRYLQSKNEQTVTVQVVVDETGAVIEAKALTGHPLLRAACEISARKAKFAPTLINMPIKVPGILIYKFKPDGTISDDFPKL